jgi:hypothetical protein
MEVYRNSLLYVKINFLILTAVLNDFNPTPNFKNKE